MVDALNRARGWLAPHGRLIDIHPTPEPAHVEVRLPTGPVTVGDLEDQGKGLGPQGRHANADEAVDAAIARGWFELEDRRVFTFLCHADTLADLQEHAASKWKNSHFGKTTIARASLLLALHPQATLQVREEITICRLRPLSSAVSRSLRS